MRLGPIVGTVVCVLLDRWHLGFGIPVLAGAAVVLTFRYWPRSRREGLKVVLAFAQILLPIGGGALLSATGGDHEGGWTDSGVRENISTMIVVAPLIVGIFLTWMNRGRRRATLLISVAAFLTGGCVLFGFMLIGT